ncbi:MAG: hypothetical protein J5956_10070 [Ruminococcus sp.]|nr:hypothetical protein [Ruminococcus sp.]
MNLIEKLMVYRVKPKVIKCGMCEHYCEKGKYKGVCTNENSPIFRKDISSVREAIYQCFSRKKLKRGK